jgi:hypothetical protein
MGAQPLIIKTDEGSTTATDVSQNLNAVTMVTQDLGGNYLDFDFGQEFDARAIFGDDYSVVGTPADSGFEPFMVFRGQQINQLGESDRMVSA